MSEHDTNAVTISHDQGRYDDPVALERLLTKVRSALNLGADFVLESDSEEGLGGERLRVLRLTCSAPVLDLVGEHYGRMASETQTREGLAAARAALWDRNGGGDRRASGPVAAARRALYDHKGEADERLRVALDAETAEYEAARTAEAFGCAPPDPDAWAAASQDDTLDRFSALHLRGES